MSPRRSAPPSLACRLLAAVLPETLAGRSTLGDLIEEYSRRPRGLRRRVWFWLMSVELIAHYLPSQIVATIGGVGSDLVYATRLARRDPGLVVAAVASLGLAIGLCTAAFTIANGSWLRPRLADDPAIVKVWRRHATGAKFGWPESEFRQLQASAQTIALEGAIPRSEPIRWPSGSAAEPQRIEFVTGGFFPVLRARPSAGRLLTPDDDRAGATGAVVLAHLFWRRQFAADPGVIGRSMSIRGVPLVIVGIAARDFVDPTRSNPEMWASLAALNTLPSPNATPLPPEPLAIGRLKPGATVADANLELTRLLSSVAPAPKQPRATGFESFAATSPDEINTSRRMLTAAFAAIALVLLLASANVSNLQLAGAEARRQELALRVSLGASRPRVFRQLMTEGLMLSVVSCLLGFFAAEWLSPIMAAGMNMPGADLDPDPRVYVFVAIAAVLTAVPTALAPGFYGGRGQLAAMMTDGRARESSGRSGRVRSILVGTQAAASIMLVTLAALQVRTLLHLTWMDPGTAVEELVSVAVPRRGAGPGGDAGANGLVVQALARVRAVAGVDRATLAAFAPFNITLGDPDHQLTENETGAEYFDTVGLRVLRGRTYTAAEVTQHQNLAVISEMLARRYWPAEDPLGMSASRIDSIYQSYEVIGIVADAFVDRVYGRRTPTIYLPLTEPDMFTQIVVRTRTPEAVAAAIRRTLDEATPELHARATVIGDVYQRQLAQPRRYAALGASVGVFALVLSAAGLIGVTSFSVRRRTREIGLRIALGARRGEVLRMMLREGVRPVVVGLIAGLAAAMVGGQAVSGVLFGMSARDPLAIGAAVVTLLVAATVAVWLPARRAAQLDPAVVLRES